MMTRKDYVTTAEIINSYASEIKLEVLEDLVNDFIVMFSEDNERFDSDRFWDECFKNIDNKKKELSISIICSLYLDHTNANICSKAPPPCGLNHIITSV
jgi:hypothetical protein